MKIAIGTDHGGYDLKEDIKKYLSQKGHEVADFGCNSRDSVDYPEYGISVSRAVSAGKADRGILICSTGVGMSITANKIKGIRAALCADVYTAKMSRRHNDANVLVLGAKILSGQLALEITNAWLATDFEGGRHQRRLDKIKEIEK